MMQFVHNLHFYCAYFTVTTSTCFPELLFLREIHPPMKQDFCSDTTLMGLVLFKCAKYSIYQEANNWESCEIRNEMLSLV